MPARTWCLVFCLWLTSAAADAAQLSATNVNALPLHGKYILIGGEIDVGDWSKFFRLIRNEPDVSGVILQSMGGSADDGLAIAKYVFEHKLDTVAAGDCHSICAVVFLAGEARYLTGDAAITFHSAYKQLGDWVVEDHQTNGTVAWFLGHMGYPLQLARLWVGTPSDTAAAIAPEMYEELGLVVIDAVGDQ